MTRRSFLIGVGTGVGATALLAACGGSAVGNTASTTAVSSAPHSSASSRGVVTPGSTTSGAASSTSRAAPVPPAASAVGKLRGTVRIVWADPKSRPGYLPLWEKTFSLFQQQQPGVKIQPIWFTGSRHEKILTLAASGDPGELFWTNNADAMHEFSARKISRPMDDLVARSKYDLSQHYAQVIAMNRYQGKLYGLPQDSHPGIAGILYNTDLFQKAGVAAPAATWTYNDFVAVAQKLATPKAAAPVFGTAGFDQLGRWLTPLYSWGADLLDQTGQRSTVLQSKTVEVFTWLDHLFHQFNVYPDPATVSKLKGPMGMFKGSSVAMYPAGYWEVGPLVKAAKGLSWKTVPVPVGAAGRVSGYAANDNFSLFTAGKNLDAAWEYILVWMRNEIMLQVVQIGLNPASKPAVNRDPSLRQLPYADAVQVYVTQLESNQYNAVPTPANQLQHLVLDAGNKAVGTLWHGGTSVDQVLQTLNTQVQAALAQPLPS